ncbi:MAG: HD domain-containing protein [bacterium]|nr:HD domain-containing protein [bacterium]
MPDNDQFLNDLAEGDRFVGFVALRRMETRQRKDGSPYLVLDFSDRSGRLGGKLWDHVDEFRKTLKVGMVVKLQGAVTIYQDQKEIQIERLRPLRPEESVDKTRLIACSERPVDEMRRHVRRLIESIENADLRSFLRRFFDDPTIAEPYFEAPAGKQWHGAYLGGLVEHSLNIAEILLRVAELYPDADKDLLIAGALLHDVGKIKEFCWEVSIDYTDQGRLIGHIVLGQELLANHRKLDTTVPQEQWDHLIHLVLSHQGTREQGAVTLPMTLEAILLYAADEMDSKANAFYRIIQRSRERGDRWTEWVNLMDRYLYTGGGKKKEEGE